MKFQLAILFALFSYIHAFAPVNYVSRSPTKSSTIVMDGKTRILRDRIKSIKNTRRITEAMRLVAAARVRRAQEAVLRTRPLIGQLQMVRSYSSTFYNKYYIIIFLKTFIINFYLHNSILLRLL